MSIVLFLLVGSCCLSYYWIIPEAIGHGKTINDNDGYWGLPTGEFNWCEYNYTWSYYISEPFNAISSLLYVIGSMIHYNIMVIYYQII